MQQSINHLFIIKKSWPIILANAAVPLLGVIDTAVIGNQGTAQDLGAIALGSIIFSFVYWSFGFLRMGTTGFTAQAAGKQDESELRAVLGRSLTLAVIFGFTLVLFRAPIADLAFYLLSASNNVEEISRQYFSIRIFGAPATLTTYCFIGVLIGLGESRRLLLIQVLLNGLNGILDIYLAGYMQMGAKGIAYGTLIAEWITAVCAFFVVMGTLRKRQPSDEPFWPWQLIFNAKKMRAAISANVDILIRTLLLVFSFSFFTNQSAQYGDIILGANHILMQFLMFSSFFLDGFAYVAEALVGESLGAKNYARLRRAISVSSTVAMWTSLLLALLAYFLGDFIIAFLTDIPEVRTEASKILYLAAIYIGLGFMAFQMDGIFIGATYTAQMRNAAILSTAGFLGVWLILEPRYGVTGLWLSFIIYVVLRALALCIYLPKLLKQAGTQS